jgi:predicted metal-dependent phosphoesterase TrpH
MAVDLHTHSRESDGSDKPADLIKAAAAAGLGAVALTDHDTLSGIPEAQSAADRHGIRLIPGTELSLDWPHGGMHLVVLWLEPGPGPLQDALSRIQAARASRNERMVKRLNELGYDISLEEIFSEAGSGVVGRPHFAAVLVRKGYFPEPTTVFDKLLATGRPGYLGRERLAPEQAIDLAVKSGAVAVLAHPHTLGHNRAEEFAATFERLSAAGLAGIECYYPEYGPDERTAFAEHARSFGLVAGGGSDYHGTYKAGLQLGTGRSNNLHVPDRVVEELEEARP